MGKQGKTGTNKVNIINMIKGLIYLGIPSNMACFCMLMAQNWHKNFALMRTWNWPMRCLFNLPLLNDHATIDQSGCLEHILLGNFENLCSWRNSVLSFKFRQSVFAVLNTGWKDSGGTSLSVPHLPTSILALQFLEWFRFAGSTTAIVDILNQIDQLTPMV